MKRITGQQAKEWMEQVDESRDWDNHREFDAYVDAVEVLRDEAEALTETVAWALAKEPTRIRESYTDWKLLDRDGDPARYSVSSMDWKGNVLLCDDVEQQAHELTPDETEELGCSLLAAAAKARLFKEEL